MLGTGEERECLFFFQEKRGNCNKAWKESRVHATKHGTTVDFLFNFCFGGLCYFFLLSHEVFCKSKLTFTLLRWSDRPELGTLQCPIVCSMLTIRHGCPNQNGNSTAPDWATHSHW
jgi:hypothetical protein